MEVTDRLVMDEATSVALEDKQKSDAVDKPAGRIYRYVRERFEKASDSRESEETRWLMAYRNYRGLS